MSIENIVIGKKHSESIQNSRISRVFSDVAGFNEYTPDKPYINFVIKEDFYIAGEKVFGQIFLNLPVSLSKIDVILSSQGIEEFRVYKGFELVSEEKNIIYKFNISIRYWEFLSSGSYLIPFSFKLPSFCPSTFFYSGEDLLKNFIKGEVSYTLSTKLSYNSIEISQSRTLNIRSITCLSSSKIETELVNPVNRCCFFNGGLSILQIKTQGEDHPTVNESISYHLIVNNTNCFVPITQITGLVVNELVFSDNKNVYKVEKVISQISRIVWIAARSDVVNEKDLFFCNELKVNEQDINLGTIESNLISCKYFIEVIVNYNNSRHNPAVLRTQVYVCPMLLPNKDTFTLYEDSNIEIEPEITIII